MSIFIVAIVLFVIVLFFIINGLRIVPQAHVQIVERLGKYHKTMTTGVNLVVPFLDKTRLKIDMRERVYDYPNQTVITKDNVTIEINGILYYQVTDAFKAVYEVQDAVKAMEKLTQTTMRNLVGELELDETLTSRDTINSKLRDILDEATDKWGCKVNRVEIKDIKPPEDIRDAMEKQMNAERNKRAAILQAEGEKQAAITIAEVQKEAAILEAEADREAKIRRATGEAEAIKEVAKAKAKEIEMVYESIKNANPDDKLVQLKSLEALQEVAKGDANKVFIPFEATGALASLGSIKEVMTDNKKE